MAQIHRPIDIPDVLSIGKLGHGQERYYLDSVAGGIEDYYSGEGEAPGRWTGSGSRALGLSGDVEALELRRVLSFEHPETGISLAERRGGLRVPGFDLTFSAPKSVSLLWALGEPRTRDAIRECHDRAVDAALGYIEREAARVRRGTGGGRVERPQGLVAAAFPHRSSRAGDPQLHTHVLVANLAKGPDGRYSALYGQRLYHHAKSAGYLYQAQLRHELERELELSFEPVRRGSAEIEGAPAEALRAFSRRRVEIERAMAERGEATAKAAQVAALDSRRGKEYGVSAETIHERWRERAAELGTDPVSWGLGHNVKARADLKELALLVTADRSHFDRRAVIEAICEAAPGGLSVERAERMADRFLASREVTFLADSPLGARYTTPEILRLERTVIEAAERLRGHRIGSVRSEIVERLLAERPTIGSDQAEMVRRLTGDGDGVAVVVGRPGTGKTFALNAAAETWRAEGFRVRGAAPTRVAATELETAAGIPSVSVAALLAELDDRAANPYGLTALPPGAVLVVDEAAMVGTRSIARLLEHVEVAQGKLVLVGDHRQLPELDAGGAFAALAERTNVIELHEVRRQAHALDRENVERIRQGRAGEAFELYRSEGRVVIAPDAGTRREAMVADWWHAFSEGEGAIMIAKRNRDVAELNQLARALMRDAGALGGREIEVAGQRFAAGDIVVTRVNSTANGVANRMRWQVLEVREDGAVELQRLADGARAKLERDYLGQVSPQSGAPALQHGYAGTIYMAQGQSVERAFVAAEAAMSLEEFNTALSRSIGETHIYAVSAPELEREEYAPREPQVRDPLDEILESMERPRAQVAAVDEALRVPLRDLPTYELVQQSEELRNPEPTLEEIRKRPELLLDDAGHGPEADPRVAAIDAELAERRRLAVDAARICPPPYVLEAIGARPEEPEQRFRWEQGLQEIERYRQAHGVRDSDRALGREPRKERNRVQFVRTQERVAEIAGELGRSDLTRDLEPTLERSR